MGAVTVIVSDNSGHPLPNAHVELFVLQPDWVLTDEKNTDLNGMAVLDPHLIACLYEAFKVRVDYQGVAQEQNGHLDFWSCNGRMTFNLPPLGCGPNNPCPPCTQCTNNICVEIPNCCYPPCTPPQYCVGHTCVSPAPCGPSNPCPANQTCVNGVCVPSGGGSGMWIVGGLLLLVGVAAAAGIQEEHWI